MTEENKTAELPLEAPAAEKPKRRVRVRKDVKNAAAVKKPAAKKRVRSRKPKDEPVQKFHRIASIPRGYALTNYTVAALTAIGAFTPARKSFKQEELIGFFNTRKVVDWHLGNGNLERTASGGIRLTGNGRNHFTAMTEGHPKYAEIVKPEIDALIEAMNSGEYPRKTAHFGAGEKFKAIEVPAAK